MALEKIDHGALQAAIHQAGESWQAGVTSVSELPDQEKRKRLGAMPPDGEAGLAQRESASLAQRDALQANAGEQAAPAAYDWRNVGGQNYITAVKDQGSCGSCVAFGSAATVEGTYRVQRGNAGLAVDLSEAHLFYCIARAQGRNCGNGWWCDKGLDAFKTDGVVDEACYPYTAGDQNCSNRCADWANRLTRISAWHEITSAAAMKDWLSTRGPLSTAFSVYNDFFAYRSGVYRHVSGALAGGHCVSVVGYWICKNSWGAAWGDHGFFNIAFGECGIDAKMWAVDGIVETGWLNSVKVTGLWTIDQDRNAWAYLGGIGWRRIAFDNDNLFIDMLTQLSAAKLGKSNVNIYQEAGIIKQVYVF